MYGKSVDIQYKYFDDPKTDYSECSDEQLIEFIHNGDERAQEFIINKYKNLVKVKARPYFIMGADKEDIIQEGMIGLYKAIRDFKGVQYSGFFSFAELCIKRQIITSIKAANRQKHLPLNSSLSLNRAVSGDSDNCTYIEMFADKLANPEELFIGQESKSYIESMIVDNLSKFECKVLALYLKGKSYFDIAAILKKDEKSIDNALQRVKKKLKNFI